MSLDRRHLVVALIAGALLAVMAKLLYDAFNGYDIINNMLLRRGLQLTALQSDVLTFVALTLLSLAAGSALRLLWPSMGIRQFLVAALPWVALTTYGAVAGFDGATHFARAVGLPLARVLFELLIFIFPIPFGLCLSLLLQRRRQVAL